MVQYRFGASLPGFHRITVIAAHRVTGGFADSNSDVSSDAYGHLGANGSAPGGFGEDLDGLHLGG